MDAAVETPQLSQAEALRAAYGHEWDIWRELTSDRKHGNWIAQRWDGTARVTAPTVDELHQKLREAQS